MEMLMCFAWIIMVGAFISNLILIRKEEDLEPNYSLIFKWKVTNMLLIIVALLIFATGLVFGL